MTDLTLSDLNLTISDLFILYNCGSYPTQQSNQCDQWLNITYSHSVHKNEYHQHSSGGLNIHISISYFKMEAKLLIEYQLAKLCNLIRKLRIERLAKYLYFFCSDNSSIEDYQGVRELGTGESGTRESGTRESESWKLNGWQNICTFLAAIIHQ